MSITFEFETKNFETGDRLFDTEDIAIWKRDDATGLGRVFSHMRGKFGKKSVCIRSDTITVDAHNYEVAELPSWLRDILVGPSYNVREVYGTQWTAIRNTDNIICIINGNTTGCLTDESYAEIVRMYMEWIATGWCGSSVTILTFKDGEDKDVVVEILSLSPETNVSE